MGIVPQQADLQVPDRIDTSIRSRKKEAQASFPYYPQLADCLNAERRSATAGGFGVRILEYELGAFQAFLVIYLCTHEILKA